MKIIYICEGVPYKSTKSSEYRNKQIIEYLSKDNDLKILVNNSANIEEYKAETGLDVEYIAASSSSSSSSSSSAFFKNLFFPEKKLNLPHFHPLLSKTSLSEAIEKFNPDLIFFTSIGFFEYIKHINIKKIFVVNKVMYMYYQRLAVLHTFLRKRLFKNTAFRIGSYERYAFINVDMILFAHINDMANVNSNMQLLTPSYYLPSYVENFDLKPLIQAPNILFPVNYRSQVGKATYDYFIANIHGKLKNKYPEYKLFVSGRKTKNMYKDEHIEFVDAPTEEILDKTRALLLPYRIRMDMQFFAILAMSRGIPVIGFEKCMDFFAVKRKDDYCIAAKNLTEFNNLFIKNFKNDATLDRVRLNAFDYVKEHYTKAAFEKTMNDCMDRFKG